MEAGSVQSSDAECWLCAAGFYSSVAGEFS